MDMTAAAARAVRAAPDVPADRKGAHRRAAPLRLLHHRIERPPQRVPALVSQAHRARSRSGSTSRSWINGETGGYLRVCTEGRNWFETDFPNWLNARRRRCSRRADRSEEHGSYIIEALETGRVVPRAFQRRQPRPHHQPAGRLRHRDPRLRRPHRHQHAGRRRSAAGLRRDLLRQRARAGDGHGGRRARRCDAAQAGDAARPAGRRGLQSGGSLADDRRDAGRAGGVAAAVRPADRRPPHDAWPTPSATARVSSCATVRVRPGSPPRASRNWPWIGRPRVPTRRRPTKAK